MNPVSRRLFLIRGSLGMAMAGLATAVPGLIQAGDNAGTAAPAVPAELPEGSALSEPFLAHVKDLSTGEINLLVGTREVTVQDPQLVARLFNATR